MSGLAALLAGHNPPDLYQWHSAAHVPDVSTPWSTPAGVRLPRRLDRRGQAVVPQGRRARRSTFDDDRGASFDTLSDCLADVDAPGRAGVVLLWDGWSPLARDDEQAFTWR